MSPDFESRWWTPPCETTRGAFSWMGRFALRAPGAPLGAVTASIFSVWCEATAKWMKLPTGYADPLPERAIQCLTAVALTHNDALWPRGLLASL